MNADLLTKARRIQTIHRRGERRAIYTYEHEEIEALGIFLARAILDEAPAGHGREGGVMTKLERAFNRANYDWPYILLPADIPGGGVILDLWDAIREILSDKEEEPEAEVTEDESRAKSIEEGRGDG